MSEQEKSSGQEALESLQGLLDNQKVLDSYRAKLYSEFKLHGKTLKEWDELFVIDFPPDLDPANCKKMNQDMLQLYELAMRQLAIADATYEGLLDGHSRDKRARLQAAIDKYRQRTGKEPPATTVKEMSNLAEGSSLAVTLAGAKIAKGFFEDILSRLDRARKIVENATMSNGTLARLYGTGVAT